MVFHGGHAMVCGVCGTRSPGNELRCIRCGARLIVPEPEPELKDEREWTAAEKVALEARRQLAGGDLPTALRSAQRAAVMEPNSALCRLVLGEVLLEMGAASDALREFRRVVELDPENMEARAKAEQARRQLVRRKPEAPGLSDWRDYLAARKQVVSVAVGVVAGLLVFIVGAVAIVNRTSPHAQVRRAYETQMRLGREHYRAGRYEEAARAFEQAWRLQPDSQEAKRRLDDALALAGHTSFSSAQEYEATGTRVASIAPLNDQSPFPPRWVGPPPRTAHSETAGAYLSPPPPIREPTPSSSSAAGADLPPPIPPAPSEPQVVESVTGPPRVEPSVAPQPATEMESAGEPMAEPSGPPLQRNRGRIVIQRHDRPVAAGSVAPNNQSEPTPDAQALRDEAERLRRSGNFEAAARKYGEAAARFRQEAQEGGAEAAAKLSAATSCDRARELCESQGN